MTSFWKALFVLLLASQVHCQLRASHNETCGEGIRCDSKKSLSCQEEICRCLKPEEMVFDPGMNMCVVLAGERCSYTAMEILKEDKRWTEKLECIPNAECNPDGYCGCSSSYFESSEGNCLYKLDHGINCTRDNQCQTGICHNGTCSCNLSEARYDYTKGRCVGVDGTPCSKYNYECVRNAICPNAGVDSSDPEYNSYQNRNIRNRRSWNDRCECDASYTKSKNGLCLAKYGMTCDTHTMPCSEDFSCIEARCGCPFPSHQRTSGGSSPCTSYVRGPCKEKMGDKIYEFGCISNAICNTSPQGISECQCEDGYVESVDRSCKLKHDQSCNKANQCDTVGSLSCRNGKCSCLDFEVYDEDKKKCRGLVGAQCLQPGDDHKLQEYCVDGAMCNNFRDPRLEKGTCHCSPKFQPNSERKCEPVVMALELKIVNANNATIDLPILPMILNEPLVNDNDVQDASSFEETSS